MTQRVDVLQFTVPGRPIPKGRPRRDSRTNHVHTPQRTIDAEAVVAQYAQVAMSRARLRSPLDVPIGVRLTFVLPDRRIVDLDNLCKLAWDAMNNLVFTDDKLIEEMAARRLIHPSARDGYTYVEIWTNPNPLPDE